jgi:hypothetical protein
MSWVKRKGHPRNLGRGRSTWIPANEAFYGTRGQSQKPCYHHPCPHCGALILSVRMKRGGWAHFEGAAGLRDIKHPCLHLGEGMSRKRDDLTRDLFEDVPLR